MKNQYTISELRFSQFRNLENKTLHVGPQLNCVFGLNGHGKTNLLEGIYFLFNKKSFRKNASFPQFLNHNGDKIQIYLEATIVDSELNQNINYSLVLNENDSQYQINHLAGKRLKDFHCIFLNPYDFYSFHNDSRFRREWFDDQFGVLSQGYYFQLRKYFRLLKQKNALLGQWAGKESLSSLTAINEEFAKLAVLIYQMRLKYVTELNSPLCENFQKIFLQDMKIELLVDPKMKYSTDEKFFHFLQTKYEEEIASGHALYGPHRDDYTLLLNGLNAFEYASLGQQKSCYLSLLFAYIELFRYKFSSYPIVLIDDISGELDRNRWLNLVEYLREKNFQVFMTTANDAFRNELENISNAKRIHIQEGHFCEMN